MKKKRMLQVIAGILSATMFMSATPVASLARGEQEAPAQGEGELMSSPEEILNTYPGPEEEEEYRILWEDEEKKEEYTKHFVTEQQTYVAAMYDEPVHYKAGGRWRDIDNELILRANEGVYENRYAAVEVKIAKKSDAADMVKVERDGHEISWGIALPRTLSEEGSAASEFEVDQNVQPMALSEEEPETEEEIEQYNQQKMAVTKTKSSGTYHEILPDMDLQYVIESNTVKENVIVKERTAAGQAICFQIHHAGYTTRLEEDGSVSVVRPEDPDSVIYRFVKPYMYDSAEQRSEEVSLLLETGSESSILILSPDKEWMESEERVYPIVIDPSTETSRETKNIVDTWVAERNPNNETFYGNGSLLIGHNSAYGKCTGLVKFNNLPTLDPGDIVYRGILSLYQYQFGVASGSPSFRINVYQPTQSWDPRAWNVCPSYDSTILDYCSAQAVAQGNASQKLLDITKLVRGWYNTGVNNGVMLKSNEEERLVVARFFTSDYPFNTGNNIQINDPQSVYPTGMIFYKNATGLEDYWSYHEQPVGRAGTGYTNDYTGNLVFTHEDAGTAGSRMPVSLSHVYNFSESKNDDRMGYGWKLNAVERFGPSGNASAPYVYTDADGTKHYFKEENGKYKDEDGQGLEYASISEGELAYKITKKDKTVLKFDQWGFLRRVTDPNENTIAYYYSPGSHADNYPSLIADGAGNTLSLHYNEDASRLTSVTDGAGRSIRYSYDGNGDLTTITYPDGTSTKYEYDSGHRLRRAESPDGYSVAYEYTEDFRVPRVSKITEYAGGTQGQTLKISYQNGNVTVFEDNGLDGDINTSGDNIVTTYRFDNLGQPMSVNDQEGNANSYKYYSEGINRHKLDTTGQMQRTSFNPVYNPNFDDTWDTWYDYQTGDLRDTEGEWWVSRQYDTGYFGNTSIKVGKIVEQYTVGVAQKLTLDAGRYTLSAYAKTEDVSGQGESAGAALSAVVGENVYTSDYLKGTTDANIDRGWKRLSVSFTVEQSREITIRGDLCNASGSVWYDCFQIDEGDTPGKYNLVSNPSFERGTMDFWGGEGSLSADTSRHGTYAGKISGELNERKALTQAVNVTGNEGDVYSLSGWFKADSLPGDSAEFTLCAAVLYYGGQVNWTTLKCNKYADGWQFVSGVVSTDDGDPSTNKAYGAIHIYAFYGNNLNTAYFDGIQLSKDEGQSYVYDREGNLTNSKSAAEQSGFVYDRDNNLTKLTDPAGSSFEYGYDDKKNLKYARNSEGVKYQFSYDSYGNPTSATVSNDRSSTAITDGRSYYIRSESSGKYLDAIGFGDSDHADVGQWEFTGAQNQKWKLIDVGNGYYKLAPAHSVNNVVLDIRANSQADGASIQLYHSGDYPSERFKLSPLANGGYQILSGLTEDKKCLSNENGNTDNGCCIKMWEVKEENGHPRQSWYLEPCDLNTAVSDVPKNGRIYAIRNRCSGQYLEVLDGHSENGGRVGQNYYSGKPNQLFQINELLGENGYLSLIPQNAPNKVLEVCRTTDQGFCPLQLMDPSNTTDEQRFRIFDNENGTYRIGPKIEETSPMTIIWDTYAPTSKVYFHGYNGTPNQQWIFEEISDQIKSSMTYTANGSQVAAVTDSRGKTVTNTYDSNNRLLTGVTDPNGNTTSYAYNSLTDQLESVSKQAGGRTVQNSYQYEYDKLRSIQHNGFSYSFEYDGFGNTLETKVGNQTLSSNTYMANNGLLDTTTYGNGDTVKFHYDKYGRETRRDYNNEEAFRYQYDSHGNPLRHEDLINGVSYRYNYDMIGRIVGLDASNGQELRVHYDDKNRVDYNISKVNEQTVKTEYLYGEKENLAQKPGLIYGVKINGQNTVGYAYDELARIQERTLNLTTPFKTSFNYLPGSAPGTTTAMVERMQNGNDILSYSYDELGNIQTITENGELKATYYYDELNQLVREDNLNLDKTITYAYDLGGNILSVTEYAYTTGEELGEPTGVKTYGYEDANWKDKLTSYNGESIPYDEIGNPLYMNGFELEWENGRQLAKASKGEGIMGGSYTYEYNDAGLRVVKDSGGYGYFRYYYNGNQLVSQTDGFDQIDFIYDETNDLFGFLLNGTPYYYIKNVQNDVIGILDSGGNQVVSYVYDSWGKMISTTGSMAETVGRQNPFRYRGYYYDQETGWYYLNSRYYDPEVGRFLNADCLSTLSTTIRSVSAKSIYAYCSNNPIIAVDKDGDFAHLAIAAAIGGAISAASQAIANVASGKPLLEGVGMAAITGAASGLLSATGLGVIGQAVGNGAISLVGSLASQAKEGKFNILRTATDTLFGAASGAIGGKGSGSIYYEKKFIKRVVSSRGKEFGKAAKYYTSQTSTNVIANAKSWKNIAKDTVTSTVSSYSTNKLYSSGTSTIIAGGSGTLAPNKTWCYPGVYI